MYELVSIKNLGKSYSRKKIFNNIDMKIRRYEPIVIMGENGCGKSTLLKIIAGVLDCTEGEIKHTDDIKISYMPDILPPVPFSIEKYLMFMGGIQGLFKSEIDEFINHHFSKLNMPLDIKGQMISVCSKGTKQKINIMQALITKPDLLILDEPFAGLDELSVGHFIDMLNELVSSGVGLVIACHESILAQRITDQIYVFHDRQCHLRETILSHYCIKFYADNPDINLDTIIENLISVNTSGELFEALVQTQKLKETVIFMVDHGYEIHSINLKQF